MNKIQNTKANTILRRFFSRLGGGGTKALGYSTDGVIPQGGGGGKEAFTSSLKEMLATIPDMVWYPKLDALWEFDGEYITSNVKVSVGDELTLEELFYADDYNVLRIYMYLLTVTNFVPKNLSLGSGAPNRILGGWENNRIYFDGDRIEDSPIPYHLLYMMTLVDWPSSYSAEEGYEKEFFWIHPNNEETPKIGFFYNRDEETCKVISITQE